MDINAIKNILNVVSVLSQNTEKEKEINELLVEIENNLYHNCICCGENATISIELCVSPGNNNKVRYYIPNQSAREFSQEVWFCHKCMRKIEDNLRATICYLQSENCYSNEKDWDYYQYNTYIGDMNTEERKHYFDSVYGDIVNGKREKQPADDRK